MSKSQYFYSLVFQITKKISILFKKKHKLVKDSVMNKLSGIKTITDQKLEKLLYLIFYSNEFFGSIKKADQQIVASLENLVKTIKLNGELYKVLHTISISDNSIKIELEKRMAYRN